MKQRLRAILHSYSDILFLHNKFIGIILLIATLYSPNVGVAGIISIIASYLFARFIEMGDDFLAAGFYTYNPLLVGLSIGSLFMITPITICFIIAASIFTFVLTVSMSSIFSYYLRLPVLSLPFAIVSSIVYLASSQFSNLFVTSGYANSPGVLDFAFPFWLDGFFKSLGALFFLPYVLPGMLFALNILIVSRILFLLAVVGYFAGTFITGAMEGSYQQAFSQVINFNYILISMSVGGIFLIPSFKSYTMALIAVFTSTIVLEFSKVFYMHFGIPGFAFPFNFVTLSFVYVLGTVNFSLIARYVRKTPEETLDYYLSRVRRYKGSAITLALPFSGKWNVWQGFDSKWTHQHSLKHAYDFVITGQDGKTHRNTGSDVKDYYCFRKPVLSPIRGRVTTVVNNIDDNPIGQVDQANNWGNLVVIHDPRGYYIEISHFTKDSILVKKGDWVERGVLLGLCGNSGYSPQPHI
ncbi:MAG: urea transporter, partial [Chlamydiales bacterium]